MISKLKSSSTLLSRIAPFAFVALASTNLVAEPASALEFKGDNEVPAVSTRATGSGSITVDADRGVSGSIKTDGVMATAAHIHAGEAGKNGPVVIPLVREADGSFTVPANAKLTEAQYVQYEAGNLYVNVHSTAHPDGEIRAQLAKTGTPAPKAEAKPATDAKAIRSGY